MPRRLPHRAQPTRPTARVDAVVAACRYEIATGALAAGARLPSLRQARDRWRANHITVLRAYRRLIAAGLVEARPRAGYFVRQQANPRRSTADYRQPARVYELLERHLLPGQTIAGLLRSLLPYAQSRADREPECAFVECTMFQADGHAREVARRFDLPCRPICLGAAEDFVGAGTRLLLTTSFHSAQVARLARRRVD